MPKVQGPLFSIKAKGTLGKTLTYKKGVFGNVVRKYRKLKTGRSAGQSNIRVWFQRGVWTWQGKSDEHGYYFSRGCYGLQDPARKEWRLFRTVKSLYGYYAFLKRWMLKSLTGQPQYQVPPYFGFCLANEWFANFLYADGKFHDWTSALPPIPPPPPPPSQYVAGIVKLYHMNAASWNGTPGEVIDSSGNGIHGVRLGNADTAPGFFNRCGDMDPDENHQNTTDFLELDESVGTEEFTLLAWVYSTAWYTSPQTRKGIVGCRHTGRLWWMRVDISGGLGYLKGGFKSAPAVYNEIGGVTPLSINTWYMVALSYDKVKLRFSINGVMDKEQNESDIPFTGLSKDLIGADIYDQRLWIGLIDEVAIFNRGLTYVELLAIYNNNLPLRATP